MARPGLFQNGKRLERINGGFRVTKDDGQSGVIQLGRTWLDPVPVVYLDSQTVRLVRPLKWQEIAWPCLLVLAALFAGLYLIGLVIVFLLPHLAESFREDGCGRKRHLLFGIKTGFILALFIALAWLTYPGIGPKANRYLPVSAHR